MNISKMQAGADELLKQNSLNRMERPQQDIRPEPARGPESAADTVADQVSVSPVWESVARKVDVTHASPREILALSQELYDAQAISHEDHISLSFQPEINLDSPSESLPFSHDKKDYTEIWRLKQENVIRSGGDRQQIEDTLRVQSILNYLSSLR